MNGKSVETCLCASVLVDGRPVKSGLFLISLDKFDNLISLVRKGAMDCGGIGQIHHQDTLVYECNAQGEKTSGTWFGEGGIE